MLHAGQLGRDGQAVSDCALTLTPARRLWLEQLDRDASALLDHLSQQRSQRLGVYFEHLWHFFLAQDPGIELVAHNLPVRDQGQTLGEFDCIYRCHQRQRYVHLELAVKFFLGYRQGTANEGVSQWHEWLGPNTRDRLELKITHLIHHQMLLGEHPGARELLDSLGIPELDKELAIKGYLFQSISDPLPPPPAVNNASPMEQWLHIDQLAQYLDSTESLQYLVLPKSRWLAAACAEPHNETFGRERLQQHLQSHFCHDSRAQLVAALDQSGRECHRFFVTGPHWPQGI
jgi:hypothetical protein